MTTKNAKKTTSTKSTKSSAKKSAAPKAPKFGPVSHVSLSRTKKAGEYAVTVNGKPAGFVTNDPMTGWAGTGAAEQLLVDVDGFEALLNSAAVADKNVKPSPVAKGNKAVDAKEAKKAAKKAKGEKVKRVSSGSRIREMLKEGMETEAILATIKKEFPDSKATKADVSWNKWAMNSGHIKG